MAERDLSYDIVQKTRGESPVLIGHVRAICSVCNHIEEIPWRGHHNPHRITNHFKKLGWDFDTYRRSKLKCPKCKTAKSPSNVGERLPEFNTFGERFRYLREQAHLKRDSVALEAGIDINLLAHMESGRESIFKLDESSANKLISVLRGHGVPVNRTWLLDWRSQGSTLAANVKHGMEKYHFTEGSLADKSRVPLSQIKLILSGAIPTHHRLPEIAAALQTTVEKLIGAPEKSLPTTSVKKISTDVGNTIAERLREARRAKDMSQARLAEAIKNEGSELATATIVWALSRIERNVQVGGQTQLLLHAADILGVRPDWLMARVDDPAPVTAAKPAIKVPTVGPPSLPAPVIESPPRSLPTTAVPVPSISAVTSHASVPEPVDLDLLRGQLERAESEIADLKEMLGDTTALLLATKAQLAILCKVTPSQVTPSQVTPSQVPAIINGSYSETRAVNGSANDAITEAVEEVVHEAMNGSRAANGTTLQPGREFDDVTTYIDRNCDSKQNTFARELLRVGARDLTIDIVESRMSYVLRRLIPPRTDTRAKQRAYIHSMMRREVIAENGILLKTGPGCWSLRQTVTI